MNLPASRPKVIRRRCHPILLCGTLLVTLSLSPPAEAGERTLEVQQADGSTWTIQVRPRPQQSPQLAQRPSESPAETADQAPPADAGNGASESPQLPSASGQADGDPEPGDPDIDIIPAVPADSPGVQYSRIYHSIPYNRAEFLANPMYRHQATMEILLGELRPMIVDKSPAPPARQPEAPLLRWFFPYGVPPAAHAAPHGLPRAALPYDLSRGPYSRYQHLFGYSGGYRLKYYLGGGFGRSR